MQAAELGRWGVARTVFEHGLQQHPKHAVMTEKLAEVQVQLGDWQAAQPVLARILAKDPTHPRALQLQAAAELAQVGVWPAAAPCEICRLGEATSLEYTPQSLHSMSSASRLLANPPQRGQGLKCIPSERHGPVEAIFILLTSTAACRHCNGSTSLPVSETGCSSRVAQSPA